MKHPRTLLIANIYLIMRRYAVVVMIGASAFSLQAQQWVPVPDAPSGNSICVATSSEDLHLAQHAGRFLVSGDGGLSFDSVETMFTTEWISDMHFPSDQVGYACGGSHYGVHKMIIVKTIDGGTTWEPVTHDEFDWFSFWNIGFLNEQIGFVSGDVGTFLRTTDGGDSFTTIALPLEGINDVTDIDIDGDVVHISTRNKIPYNEPNDDLYRILRSVDEGLSWEVIYADTVLGRTLTTDRSINSVRFRGDFGLAVGNNGLVLRTTDGGSSWSETILMNDTTFFFDIELVDEQTAFIMTKYAYAGGLRPTLRTDDGGLTWVTMNEMFRSMTVREGVGYAVDGQGDLFKNLAIINSINTEDPEMPILYPNPTNDRATVVLDQGMRQVTMDLLDVNGRTVPHDISYEQGVITVDLSGSPAGIYVLRVDVGDQGKILTWRIAKQ